MRIAAIRNLLADDSEHELSRRAHAPTKQILASRKSSPGERIKSLKGGRPGNLIKLKAYRAGIFIIIRDTGDSIVRGAHFTSGESHFTMREFDEDRESNLDDFRRLEIKERRAVAADSSNELGKERYRTNEKSRRVLSILPQSRLPSLLIRAASARISRN